MLLAVLVLLSPAAQAAPGDVFASVGLGVPQFGNIQVRYELDAQLGFLAGAGLMGIPSLRMSCQADVHVGLSSVYAGVIYRPSEGPFFIGGLLGYQYFSVYVNQKTVEPFYTSTYGTRSVLLTPYVGWLFPFGDSRWTYGFDIGLQIPFWSRPDEAHRGATDPNATGAVRDQIDFGNGVLGRTPFPYIAVFRIGYSWPGTEDTEAPAEQP